MPPAVSLLRFLVFFAWGNQVSLYSLHSTKLFATFAHIFNHGSMAPSVPEDHRFQWNSFVEPVDSTVFDGAAWHLWGFSPCSNLPTSRHISPPSRIGTWENSKKQGRYWQVQVVLGDAWGGTYARGEHHVDVSLDLLETGDGRGASTAIHRFPVASSSIQ